MLPQPILSKQVISVFCTFYFIKGTSKTLLLVSYMERH